MRKRPTIKHIRECFSYDPANGEIRWLRCRHANRVGSLAGWISGRHPYRRVNIHGEYALLAHHVAWAIHYGRWPKSIDHINGDGTDNRLCNLRECHQKTNSQNIRKAKVNSLTQVLGVWKHPNGRFRATICIDGKSKHIGYFSTPEDAHIAYRAMKAKVHPGCTI